MLDDEMFVFNIIFALYYKKYYIIEIYVNKK